jgi:hypothetical protein
MFRKFLMGTVSHIPFYNVELDMTPETKFEREFAHTKLIVNSIKMHNELFARGEV